MFPRWFTASVRGKGVDVNGRFFCRVCAARTALYYPYTFRAFYICWSVVLGMLNLLCTVSLYQVLIFPRYSSMRFVCFVLDVSWSCLFFLVVSVGAQLLPPRRDREPQEAHRWKVLRRDAALVQWVRREHRGAC